MSESESGNEQDAFQYKFILLGDGAVGKTSLAVRFAEDEFGKQYKQTIGLDWFMRKLSLRDGTEVAIQLWDIGGQSISGKMIGNYIFGAHAVMLCYDVTNYQSFQNLEDWLRLVRKTFASEEKKPLVALVGNKSDLGHLQTVKLEKHKQFMEENGIEFNAFVSAKSGDSVFSSFFSIAAELSGVAVSKSEIDSLSKPVRAEIVNHPNRHVPGMEPGSKKEVRVEEEGSYCSLQ